MKLKDMYYEVRYIHIRYNTYGKLRIARPQVVSMVSTLKLQAEKYKVPNIETR
jgi:hypothetical protein